MTKYILVGGYPHKASDGGKAFAEELVKGFQEPVKLVDCLFARPRENWEKAYAQDKEFFTKYLPNTKLNIILAEPEKFLEQLEWADVLYVRGGENDRLKELFEQWPGWEKLMNNKTVAGSSAGANMFSKYFYGLDDLKMWGGADLLPIKVIVHYGSDYNAPNIDWDKAEAELKNYKEELPMLKLAEGQFEVITQ